MIGQKKAWILEHDMTVIRCHDIMDRVHGFGISWSLGKTLGFEEFDFSVNDLMYKVYIIQPDTAYNVTVKMAKKLAEFNQGGIHFYGDGNRIVQRIGIGTGCICDPVTYMEYSADYYLAINDSISTWTQAPYSNDSGLPMGVIDHGVSEEAGMRALCEHLNENYYFCTHINGGAQYQFITA
jgi:putative NIF3 family GTP cyclohydrolase 1 type 2